MSSLIQRDYCLQDLNTLAVPCQATAYARLLDPAQFLDVFEYGRAEGLPLLPLGSGSNVVLAEQLESLVVQQACSGRTVLEVTNDSDRVRVGAGESWHQFVTWSLQQGYCGLENLALIPGTVGAAPVQNIGAYGVELAEFVESVRGVSLLTGEALEVSHAECQFAYRDSVFKRDLADQIMILSVDLRLPHSRKINIDYPALAQYFSDLDKDSPTPMEVFEAVVNIRSSKLPDPAQIPNAGSFFKNPVVTSEVAADFAQRWPEMPLFAQLDGSVRVAAAWLIQCCGFKLRQDDPVHVHANHALVITNPQRRGGSEVLQLAEEIVAAVLEQFDIELEQEPRSYGWI
jgi:UDP-N-acetylmuramate dehydrogenase